MNQHDGPERRLPALALWPVLVLVSVALGASLTWAGLPAGFLLGAMVTAIGLSVTGASITIPRRGFRFAQVIVGLMIAHSITMPILYEIGREWPVFVAGVGSVVLVSLVVGWLLTRWQILPGPTAIWGVSPGAAVAMTLMSGAYGADERLVAFMQYTRVVIVASSASIVAALAAPGDGSAPVPADPGGSIIALIATLLLAGLCWWLANRWRLPAAPLLVGIGLGTLAQNAGGLEITLPQLLLEASFLLIGWMIGSRFTRTTLAHALRALPAILASILILVLVCGGIAALLVIFGDVDPLTAYLATSPGGADTVAIVAGATGQVDVAYVMAMQMARFLAVMLAGPWLARLMTYWAGYARPESGRAMKD